MQFNLFLPKKVLGLNSPQQSIMQKKTFVLLVALSVLFVTPSLAQPKNYSIQNFIGIGGGLSIFDINTDEFITTEGNGWYVGASADADLPNKWFNISYSLHLSENKFDLSGRVSDDVAGNESIRYKMFAAQLGFDFHVKLIGPTLTLDIGPRIQYNGNLELDDDSQESYFLNNFDSLQATDISEIGNFNLNAMGGVSLNLGRFKLRGQYIYGFTNMLNKLNSADLNVPAETDFKGNQSQFLFGAYFML